MATERLFLADDAATAALGAALARDLRAGDLVLLEGGLGAGKTALARALIRTLLDDPLLDVPSPSFALVQPYEGTGHLVLHADLYRIRDPREVDELGLFDRPEAIVLVEWPERDHDLPSRPAIKIALTIPADGHGRVAEITR
ncbi:MAG TPA: tRNA (adenosine(37)-N6)-threonylcarbamoyltransferase complex ATPase subunit type 1 TsaE [Devosia sp.]|nr:tRNA (adenosine(37)-N6)-threonylcarbamoyltransferase complex ATPase subunit type 1 TsaE [Devosia sp.]